MDFSFSIKLSMDEYKQFAQYCDDHYPVVKAKSSKPRVVLVWVAMIVVIFLLYLWADPEQFFQTMLLGSALYAGLTHFTTQKTLWHMPDGDSSIFSERTWRIDDEGVHESSEHGFSTSYWSSFLDLRTDGDVLYLVMDNLGTIILPMRCFASIAERDAFVVFLHSKGIKQAA